ncbi:MAG: TRAP transporter small permease [Shewanella sp.]|uniref:TRAP transporter small permease n=1 Tax=Shewanella sp. SNU WT4 TaxID=2590015 RepID=UPI00112A8418|nr:TRAP transporter small permease [Shewanella sp. SNU WT4]QDF67384.1 TRAP transporter small permease [Shewanella sp. SNU WT4]
MQTVVNAVNRGLALFTISLSCFLVCCVIWQVISRYILGAPSTVTDELARYLFMWVAMIGAAYTTGQKRHLAIDIMTMHLKGLRKTIAEGVIQIAIALFSAIVLVYGGMTLTLNTLASGQVTPALNMSMGYVYLCLPISGILMIFYSLYFLTTLIKQPQAQS